ncbi:MAG: glycosyltransferase [Bernardetiaceae bacterium]|nr:glycosyltransferase [Bernardetiaceae bacterium]
MIQYFFWIVVFGRFAFASQPLPLSCVELNFTKGVSVIVAAHNEYKHLPALLACLLEQDYPNYEIIIVNDRSTDRSLHYLQQAVAEHEKLKVVHIYAQKTDFHPKKYALQCGIEAAQYEYLLFTDADCRPQSSQWIYSMVQPFNHSNIKIILGYSPYFSEKKVVNLVVQYETFYTALQYFAFAHIGKAYMGVGRNLAYRKSYFLSQNGFAKDAKITGGDDDLLVGRIANSQNTAYVHAPESLVYSYAPTTIRAWITQKKRHLSAGKRYRSRHLISLAFLQGSMLLSYGSLFAVYYYPIIAALFALRLMLLWFLTYKAKQKLPVAFHIGYVPCLDFIYFCYLIIVGLLALFSRKIKWNNKIVEDSLTKPSKTSSS